jgi:cyanate permease
MIIKGLLAFWTLFSALNALLWGWVFVSRLRMDYNEAGRYFDANSSVVYEEQAVGFYGFLAFVSLFLTLVFLFLTGKNFRRYPSV